MNAFQKGLSRGIPLEKAGAFFVGLKSWQAPSAGESALMKQAVASLATSKSPPVVKVAQVKAPPPAVPQVKSASLRFRLVANMLKQAADESVDTDGGGSELSSPTPAAVPQEQEYLANEAAGIQAEEQNSVEYYQSLLQQLRGETSAAQQEAASATEQLQQLQAQQQEHESQIAAATQESTMAQQAALQQVQTANAAATQAMQQSVDAENRALQAKTQETTAKIQQQQVRTQLLDLAAQGLPGSEPELGGEGNAAEGMEPEQPPVQAGAAPGEQPPGAGGEDPSQEATAAAGPSAGGMNEQGQPANAEGMPGQEAAPGGAGGGAAAPGTVPQPAGDASGGSGAGPGTGPQSNTDGQAQAPEQDPSAKRQGGVSIKVGSAEDSQARLERLIARRHPPEDRLKVAFANPKLVALIDRLEGEQRLPLAKGR